MKYMKRLINLLVFFLLISCVPQKHSYHKMLSEYLNASKTIVINHFGPPDAVDVNGDSEILTYYRTFSNGDNLGFVNIAGNNGQNTNIAYTKSASTVTRKILFYIDQSGKVYRWVMI